MKVNIFNLIFFICMFTSTISSSIRPNGKIVVIDGQGFIAYLNVSDDFGNLKSCRFSYKDEQFNYLDLKSTVDLGMQTTRNETVYRYSKTVCGIRVEKVSSASIGKWNLEAKNNTDSIVNDSLTIDILNELNSKFVTNITLPIGKATVSCTELTSTRSCWITSKSGETWPDCSVYTTIREPTEFECRTMNWGIMEETIEVIGVQTGIAKKQIESIMEENLDHIVITCQNMGTIHHCRGIHPDNKTHLLIMDGFNNGKYSAYDTILSQGKCSLEIRKPIETSEKGLWKILPGDSKLEKGCLFYVGENKQLQIEEELTKMPTINTIEMINLPSYSLDIKCEVPFALNNCYLKDPYNQLYFPDHSQFEQSKNVGRCLFKNVSRIVGKWTCGLSGPDYNSEVYQHFDVFMTSTKGKTITSNIRASRGGAFELMCESFEHEPISDCAFIDPDGTVHMLSKQTGQSQKKDILYSGKGIEHGYCGVSIQTLEREDFGTWTCQFRVYSSNRAISFAIEVESQTLGTAAISGIAVAVGVLVLVGTIGGFFLYKRRKASRNLEAAQRSMSETYEAQPETS